MSVWLEQALARPQPKDWLAARRQQSLTLLQNTPWPTRKTEAWRYVPLNLLEKLELTVAAPVAQPAEPIPGLNAIDLVFSNGALTASVADLSLPEGVSITVVAGEALAANEWAQPLFASIKPERHLFGLVNDVLARDIVIIDIAESVTVDRPIRLLSQLGEGSESHTRVLVRVGAKASVSVIEHYTGSAVSLNTGFAEYQLQSEASLEHYRLALQTGAAMSFGGSHFALESGSQLNSALIGFGSQLSRVDMDVIHRGENANAKLNAIYLLDGSEIFDLHSTIEHAVPHCTTEENVRGIVADRSRAIFNGRIHIHRHAQKTLAELNNRNLLLSDDAEINTKPELEIYADDVRCAHGATVAEIDKKALYYMQSRGISRSHAQIMLSFGFINELVDQMSNEALAEWLRTLLRERFSGMEVK